MVRGFDLFAEYFRPYADRFVLIGGTACTVLMNEAGLAFRATRDLDIVLCIEALDAAFVQAFWEFIRLGGYRNQQKSTQTKLFYRFYDPQSQNYPIMLELFSRKPDALILFEESHLTPIPVDEDISSLSAILLNDEYYHLTQTGKQFIAGMPVVTPEYLIPLKAFAWLQNSELLNAGTQIRSIDIRKHCNDVFRLFQLLSPDTRVALPAAIQDDLSRFIQRVEDEQVIALPSIGIRNISLSDACRIIRDIYGLQR